MNISPEHLELIRQWAAQGTNLNDIQKKLTQLGYSIRFMDLRFYLLDHQIEIAEPQSTQPEKAEKQKEAETPEEELTLETPPSQLLLSLDEIQIPNTMISGKAIFPSGIRGSWQFDMQGNFTWSALSKTPSQEEMRIFQVELNKLLRSLS